MPVTAAVRSTDDSLREQIVLGEHVVVVDEPEDVGGTDTAPTPFELVAGGLAGCIAITLRMYAKRKEWDLGDLDVEVCLDHRDRPRSATVTVFLDGGLAEEQRERLGQVARSCPVGKALKDAFDTEYEVVERT